MIFLSHIKIRHAYDFSLCLPPELLMSFLTMNELMNECSIINNLTTQFRTQGFLLPRFIFLIFFSP
jgi:hypothetical protein